MVIIQKNGVVIRCEQTACVVSTPFDNIDDRPGRSVGYLGRQCSHGENSLCAASAWFFTPTHHTHGLAFRLVAWGRKRCWATAWRAGGEAGVALKVDDW